MINLKALIKKFAGAMIVLFVFLLRGSVAPVLAQTPVISGLSSRLSPGQRAPSS